MTKRTFRKVATASALAMVCASCATRPNQNDARVSPEQQLMQTDTEFSDLSVKVGAAEAFYQYFAEDAQLLAKGNPVVGRLAIRTRLAKLTGVLTWKPERAEVGKSRDLGCTWGRSEYREAAKDGKVTVSRGKYLSVWRRQKDGSWKVILDIGNDEP